MICYNTKRYILFLIIVIFHAGNFHNVLHYILNRINLKEIVDTLNLPATVINGRAEAQTVTCDIVTARAVAPLDKLLGYAQPYFERGAQGLFLKGERAESELIEARKSWHFEAELAPSQSDVRGRIVTIRSLRRARSTR